MKCHSLCLRVKCIICNLQILPVCVTIIECGGKVLTEYDILQFRAFRKCLTLYIINSRTNFNPFQFLHIFKCT